MNPHLDTYHSQICLLQWEKPPSLHFQQAGPHWCDWLYSGFLSFHSSSRSTRNADAHWVARTCETTRHQKNTLAQTHLINIKDSASLSEFFLCANGASEMVSGLEKQCLCHQPCMVSLILHAQKLSGGDSFLTSVLQQERLMNHWVASRWRECLRVINPKCCEYVWTLRSKRICCIVFMQNNATIVISLQCKSYNDIVKIVYNI